MFDPPRTQFSQTHHNQDWNFISNDRILQLRPNYNPNQESMENDDSGVFSPPLWKNSPSPPRSPSQPLLSHHQHNYRSLSPNSRKQAIARGQWELMEMVKNMPESSYELSLKDLVENRPGIETQAHHEEERLKNNDQRLRQRGMKVMRQESKRYDKNMLRIGSFENKGLFLNMGFPFSFNSNKKKKSFASKTNGKISPKPEVVKGGGEKDWWKKKFTGSSDSDSSRTSNNSGSSGSTTSNGGSSSGSSYTGDRKKNGLLTGCWPFLRSRRGK